MAAPNSEVDPDEVSKETEGRYGAGLPFDNETEDDEESEA